MLAKRIIPCLDVKDGRVVKGTNFVNLQDAGDPLALAKKYDKQDADELVFLDITASADRRKTTLELVKNVAKQVFIPFTVGGGISTLEDMRQILKAGADKITINTAAVKNPSLIKEASEMFGSQCIVVAIDAKRVGNKWDVFIKGGRENTGIDAIEWAKKVEQLGAGEIMLTSMDSDGVKFGYDIALTRVVSDSLNIPIIASGGAGNLDDFVDVFKNGRADAALAASVFHYGKYSIDEVKQYLKKSDIEVRIC